LSKQRTQWIHSIRPSSHVGSDKNQKKLGSAKNKKKIPGNKTPRSGMRGHGLDQSGSG